MPSGSIVNKSFPTINMLEEGGKQRTASDVTTPASSSSGAAMTIEDTHHIADHAEPMHSRIRVLMTHNQNKCNQRRGRSSMNDIMGQGCTTQGVRYLGWLLSRGELVNILSVLIDVICGLRAMCICYKSRPFGSGILERHRNSLQISRGVHRTQQSRLLD